MSRTVSTFLLLIAVAWFRTGGVAADDPKSARPITAVGDHQLFDGKLVVKVSEKDGNLLFRITRTGRWGTGTLSPPKDVKKDGAAWVIVAESPDRFWIFWDGALNKWEFADTDEGSKSSSTVITGAAILKQAPKAVLEHLPKELVDKLKGK